MSLLDGLNDRQRAAVEHRGSPLIVLAGPGTGKTRVITHRIAHLIDQGVRPDSIAAMTFTNKAAAEMKDRLTALIGSAGSEVVAGTFHSLGLRWLARFGDTIGVPSTLQLIDSAQRRDLLEEAVLDAAAAGLIPTRRLANGGPGDVADAAWAWINTLRTRAVFADDARGLAERWGELIAAPPADWDQERLDAQRAKAAAFEEAVEIYARFEHACARRGLATFDDYILLPIRILRESADAAAIIRDDIRHCVVDEYQDVNGAQLEFLKLLALPTRSPDLCVVGDDDQAIYGFRGSDTRAFEHFAQTWTDSTTITLDANYRSTPTVLAGSQRIIAKAQTRFIADKSLEAHGSLAEDESPIEAVHVEKGTPWGGVIAPMILADRAEHERPFDAYAVIANTHDRLDEIADELTLAGIPVARSRRASALDDDAVQDLLEWIRLLVEGQAYAAARLLTRPPIRMKREHAMKLRRHHRRAVAKAETEGAEGPGFIAWVRSEDDEQTQQLLAWFDELTELAANAPAHVVIARIIELTGIAHAELLSARDRAARIGHLVAVLRFARQLAARLAPPGDLAAFWSHYQRLDKADQTFRGVSHVDAETDAHFDGDGVRLLTAHQSKGLEFDTVFIPNIGAAAGMFGSARRGDDLALPAEITGHPETPSEDERRRLFYVAMTRAERRLVILSRRAKSRSSSLHMFQELAWRGKHPLPSDQPVEGVVLREDAAVLRDAAALGVTVRIDELDAQSGSSADRRRQALASARRRARLEAAEAMESADDPATTEAMLASQADRLGRAASWMTLIARLESGTPLNDLPEWLTQNEDSKQFSSDLATAIAGGNDEHDDDDGRRGLRAPLHLSYSQIDLYRRCPACYYVKHVLGLVDEPTSAQVVGTVAHGALEKFYRQWSDADNEGRPKPGKADLLRIGRDLFFEASARAGGVDRAQLTQIEAQLDAGYDAFHDDRAEIVMIEEKIKLSYSRTQGDETPHTIEAKIDRVERLPDTDGFRIVDYKTGGAWKALLEPKADDLQLGIYALALADAHGMDPTELEGEAAYWVLSTQEAGVLDLRSLDLDSIRTTIDDTITGLLEGRFERGKKCEGICRLFTADPQLQGE